MERFRDKFQRSLKSCVRKGFSVEESFGMIWVETWEEVAVTEEEQSQLFDELIGWAKKGGEIDPAWGFSHRYSLELFTENTVRLGEVLSPHESAANQ